MVLIREKRDPYRLYRFFRGIPVCACARMRACVKVRRNRYNRYNLLLYPPTSLKNQGCRANGVYQFSKIGPQKWYRSHTRTSPEKPG